MRLLGREPLTPPPPRGLIWGEGRRVLLLVRNNQSQPITFTARRALTAGMHWTLRRRNSGALQIDGCKAADKKKRRDAICGPRCTKLFTNSCVNLLHRQRWKWITTYLECALPPPPHSHPFHPNPTLVLCPGPPVLSLFCLGTGGCQSGFMSSSLELKEVSFMSCYGTRRLCPSGVMRSGPGEPGERRAGPSLGGDQQWGSQSGFCAAAVGCVFGNYPPPSPSASRPQPALTVSTDRAFQERPRIGRPTGECTTHRQQRLTPCGDAERPDWRRHC